MLMKLCLFYRKIQPSSSFNALPPHPDLWDQDAMTLSKLKATSLGSKERRALATLATEQTLCYIMIYHVLLSLLQHFPPILSFNPYSNPLREGSAPPFFIGGTEALRGEMCSRQSSARARPGLEPSWLPENPHTIPDKIS